MAQFVNPQNKITSSAADMLGFRPAMSPMSFSSLGLLNQQIKPFLGSKEQYKQFQLMQNAYKPSSLATFLFGFE